MPVLPHPPRGSGVFHRGSAANYKRIIYVKTMEFKDVTILDKVRVGGGGGGGAGKSCEKNFIMFVSLVVAGGKVN